jgi:hypothetical protein
MPYGREIERFIFLTIVASLLHRRAERTRLVCYVFDSRENKERTDMHLLILQVLQPNQKRKHHLILEVIGYR